jgi:segregation and condensation protein B
MEPPRQNAVEDPPGEELDPAPAVPGNDAKGSGEPGASAPLEQEGVVRGIATLVFAWPAPLSVGRLGGLQGRPGEARVRAAIEELGQRLTASGLPLEMREIAGGFLFLTAPELGPTVALLAERRRNERLSGAALETLAIVAYRQPVTKSEIEAIRGVQAGPILRTLVDRGLVKVTGRADQPGHALEYGTTREFLDRFGLASLGDLPRDGELARD